MLGVAVIIGILIFVPDHHQSVELRLRADDQQLRLLRATAACFWFYVLPLGFLLTMYTQTGYDASAHISEETHGAALGAAKGVWRSVFWAGVVGWMVLLAITFAATDTGFVNNAATDSARLLAGDLRQRADPAAAKAVILIATVGQLFCGMSCVTAPRACATRSRATARCPDSSSGPA